MQGWKEAVLVSSHTHGLHRGISIVSSLFASVSPSTLDFYVIKGKVRTLDFGCVCVHLYLLCTAAAHATLVYLIFCMYSLTTCHWDRSFLLFGRRNWGSVRLRNVPNVSWGDGSARLQQPLLQNPACRTACHAVPRESTLSRTRNEPSSGARHHAVCGTVCSLVLNSAGNTEVSLL